MKSDVTEQKLCCAMICWSRFWVPSLLRAYSKPSYVIISDAPADVEFIKNTGYGFCKLPGEVWDEHADKLNDEPEPGWLCKWHATVDTSDLPTATLEEAIGAFYQHRVGCDYVPSRRNKRTTCCNDPVTAPYNLQENLWYCDRHRTVSQEAQQEEQTSGRAFSTSARP